MRSPLHFAPIRHLIPVALGLFVLSALSGCFEAYEEPQREVSNPPDDAERLIGTYVLEQSESPGSPSGIGTRLEFFTGTHWIITQPDPETGQVAFHHGGH